MRTAPPFRVAFAAAFLALSPAVATAQQAREIFIVDSSDGYGIDACVASGAACGQAMADAWCRVHDYERAIGFGKMTSDATVSVVSGTAVRTAGYDGANADGVAITCGK